VTSINLSQYAARISRCCCTMWLCSLAITVKDKSQVCSAEEESLQSSVGGRKMSVLVSGRAATLAKTNHRKAAGL